MFQWQAEITSHLEEKALKCCVYYNNTFYEVCTGKRPESIPTPFNYDVVITTYDTCYSAFMRFQREKENWLFQTQWKRIIIDEGHIIKNDKYISEYFYYM